MESIDPKCTALKARYEQVFYEWYRRVYLPATRTAAESSPSSLSPSESKTAAPYRHLAESYRSTCGDAFAEYRECITKTLDDRSIPDLIAAVVDEKGAE